jgi:hypothetical protein
MERTDKELPIEAASITLKAAPIVHRAAPSVANTLKLLPIFKKFRRLMPLPMSEKHKIDMEDPHLNELLKLMPEPKCKKSKMET